jgi:tRNA pseudouridine55 synthase
MHGLLVIDKGPGLTSARAIDPVKKATRMKMRVGHAGTLDPFATGVLIVLLGDATRLANLVLALRKTYTATVRCGERTDTLDPAGEVVERAAPGPSPPADLEPALAALTGEIEQFPPVYSALKVGGTPAYRLTRNGRPPVLAPRRVVIHELRLVANRGPDLDLEVVCGSGTYIRALARDLGERIGLPARLHTLRRTAIGPFTVDEAIRIDPGGEPPSAEILAAVRPPVLIPRAVGLPELRLTHPESRLFVRGNTVGLATPRQAGPAYTILDETGELMLGIGEITPGGTLRPKMVMTQAVEEIRRRAAD